MMTAPGKEGCDQLVDDGGDATLRIHKGKEFGEGSVRGGLLFLVKPDDPGAKIKFLAAEAPRGVGGLVLDANGKRFANELGRRDYVTGEMWKNKPPFRLCLNKAASAEIAWHCKPWLRL